MKKEALLRVKNRFENKFEKIENGCWLWLASTFHNGYGQFQFEGRPQHASRVSYVLYKDEIPNGLFVCHTCDNPLCVNPEHLFLGTHKDNMQDKIKKGRHVSSIGENNGKSKLTENDVRDIRQSKESAKILAEKYSINSDYVYLIKNRKRWKHVD